MESPFEILVENLNHPTMKKRLESLKQLSEELKRAGNAGASKGKDVNNHIHTHYSFSPYSPTKAVWMAHLSKLATAGIMDHDSLGGAFEFIEAGKLLGLATTVGMECRVDFSDTRLNGRRINNPDQKGIAYIALHGIPHTQIERIQNFFAPYTLKRNQRNRRMTEKINSILQMPEMALDFDADIRPLSKYDEGGSITERHLLYALSEKLIKSIGKGFVLLAFLKNKLGIAVSTKTEKLLEDIHNPYYSYDLVGLLKGEMVASFYIEATKECPKVSEVMALAQNTGAIAAYAYLGDVGESVTGDKKSQAFEDDYIDLLFSELHRLGFHAVTYMPSRNTKEQLVRVRARCENYEFFQISGEDINSPRQSFICDAMKSPEYQNLVDAAWALIGHEIAATEDLQKGMFSENTLALHKDLEKRICQYKEMAIKASAS